MTRATQVAKHPASIWAAIIAMLIPALIDRYIAQPEEKQQEVAVEKMQWRQLDEAFAKSEEEIRRLEISIVRLEESVKHLMRGQRSEARERLEKKPEPTKASRSIALPQYDDIMNQATK